jgi:hypothetical protein
VRFTAAKTVAVARAEFAQDTPRVEILFDNGAGPAGPGDPQSTYSAGYTQWPPSGQVSTYYLGAGGSLAAQAPAISGRASFTLDPKARPATSLPIGDNPWVAAPAWNWTTVPAADGIGFQTAPFTRDTTIAGPATLDLWVKAAAAVEDYQVTVTEVRPSAGREEYVTSGFLRSSNRVEQGNSTALFTDPTYLASQARRLSSSRYSLVKIPVDPIVHTFRAGTELRLVLSAPGGDRPSWAFATLDHGQRATVAFGGKVASALVVDIVQGVSATAILPTCGTLRGEPCRVYQAEGNQAPGG